MKKIICFGLTLSLLLANTFPALAGGALETYDITAQEPSPIAGQIIARPIPRLWDSRTIPVTYSVNNTLDPIPNPLGDSILTLEAAIAVLQRSFDSWNNIRTSFIDMRIGNQQTSNSGFVGFDFVNELSFRSANNFSAIASSPSIALIRDVEFVDGDRIDNDDDSDVSSAITVATDVDGDGDIEFPAGLYKAGTILDNDVQFNTKTTNGFRFTVDPTPPDNVARSVDLEVVATHEFGHSHGLSHSIISQISRENGDGATMFPSISTRDPQSEINQRTLATDDIAFSSYLYPEGSARTGPPALQRGDVPFRLAYGLIKGNLQHGQLNEPLIGGHVFAANYFNKSIASGAYTGTSRLSYNPTTGGLFFLPRESGIVDGNYVLPVPVGTYEVGVEAVDGEPASAAQINFTTQIGAFYGQQNFNEDYYSALREADTEIIPRLSTPVLALPGSRGGVNLITNRTININNFQTFNSIGFTGVAPGTYYAVQVPASEIAALNPDQNILFQSAEYHTTVADNSVVPVFAEALLTTGTITESGAAQLDLANPLARDTVFAGQDNDFTPFYFKNPFTLGRDVREKVKTGEIQNLFVVLRIPDAPFPGTNNLPPLVGLDLVAPFARSFISRDNGATFNRVTNAEFRFRLVLSELPTE